MSTSLKDTLSTDEDNTPLPSQKTTQKASNETDETYQKTEDVTSALTNLGYQKIEAYKVATDVCLNNPDQDLSSLIRLALKEFNK